MWGSSDPGGRHGSWEPRGSSPCAKSIISCDARWAFERHMDETSRRQRPAALRSWLPGRAVTSRNSFSLSVRNSSVPSNLSDNWAAGRVLVCRGLWITPRVFKNNAALEHSRRRAAGNVWHASHTTPNPGQTLQNLKTQLPVAWFVCAKGCY